VAFEVRVRTANEDAGGNGRLSLMAVSAESEPLLLRFGPFELDPATEQLRKNGRLVPLQPQPFKLLYLLAKQGGGLVSRDEIRAALWSDDTFVNFEQGVNFAMRQVREALGEQADRPLFIQTIPKRGYRFVAPIDAIDRKTGRPFIPTTDGSMNKLLWTNIAELRMAETARQKQHQQRMRMLAITIGAVAVVGVLLLAKLVL
jgi:DNA-binding winged helix-turn-helix (wHTH) protein